MLQWTPTPDPAALISKYWSAIVGMNPTIRSLVDTPGLNTFSDYVRRVKRAKSLQIFPNCLDRRAHSRMLSQVVVSLKLAGIGAMAVTVALTPDPVR